MFCRIALVFVVFLSHVVMAFSENIAFQPAIAPLPDHVIIQHWKDRIASTKTIYAEFNIARYDDTFETIKYGKGKLFIKGKKECRFEVMLIDKKTMREIQEKRKGKCSSVQHSIYLWKDDDTLTVIYPVEKSYSTIDVKKDLDSPIFYNFSFRLHHFPRYQMLTPHAQKSHPSNIRVRTTGKHYFITFIPTGKRDVNTLSEVEVAIDMKTEKLKGICITSPSRNLKTTWWFSKFEVNQHIQDDKGLLDILLKGYHDSAESIKARRKEIKPVTQQKVETKHF